MGKNIIIFGLNMSLSVHIDNKNKEILIFGEGSTQGLDDSTLTVETQHSINFSRLKIKICLRLHYNGGNRFLFVDTTKVYQFKANDSEIKKISIVFRKSFKGYHSC